MRISPSMTSLCVLLALFLSLPASAHGPAPAVGTGIGGAYYRGCSDTATVRITTSAQGVALDVATARCGLNSYAFEASQCEGTLQDGMDCVRPSGTYPDGSPTLRLTVTPRGGFGFCVGSSTCSGALVMGTLYARTPSPEAEPLDPGAGATCTPQASLLPRLDCRSGDGNLGACVAIVGGTQAPPRVEARLFNARVGASCGA